MKMKTKTFLDETLELLDASTMTMSRIANGAQVGERWLYKLKNRKAKDPSLLLTDKVNRYLRFISISKKTPVNDDDKPASPNKQVQEVRMEACDTSTSSARLANNNNKPSADATTTASACQPSTS